MSGLIITQARMGSTRLPGKVMKTVKGRSLLQYHLDRLAASGLPVVVATTTETADDAIEDFCQKNGIACFRGSESDVLARYAGAAKKMGGDVVIRVTSDCPLVDGNLIRRAFDYYRRELDLSTYLSNASRRTFARGFDFEIFSRHLLEEADRLARDPSDREHVTPFIRNAKIPGTRVENWADERDASHLRITVDQPEDFELVRRLIEEESAETKSYQEITDLLLARPDLVALNAHVEQKKT